MAPVDESGQTVTIGQQFELAARRFVAEQRGVQTLGGFLDGMDFGQADLGKFRRWLSMRCSGRIR